MSYPCFVERIFQLFNTSQNQTSILLSVCDPTAIYFGQLMKAELCFYSNLLAEPLFKILSGESYNNVWTITAWLTP